MVTIPYGEHVRNISHMIEIIGCYIENSAIFVALVIDSNCTVSITDKNCTSFTYLVLSTLVMVCIFFFVLLFCYWLRDQSSKRKV